MERWLKYVQDGGRFPAVCFSSLLLVAGGLFFMWFFLPAVFKRVLNAGNVCGMALSLALVCYGLFFCRINRWLVLVWQQRAGRMALFVAVAFAAAAAAMSIAAATAIVRAGSVQIPEDTPVVVLGCSVIGERPSRILQERIDAAYAYLQEHPGAVAVLSGGQGRGEDISEAECMYRALVAAGIEKKRLYREDASTNTRENLVNSQKVLARLGKAQRITVLSSEFHLYRGRRQAQALGMENYGYGARTDWRYLPTFFLREMIAVVALWIGI